MTFKRREGWKHSRKKNNHTQDHGEKMGARWAHESTIISKKIGFSVGPGFSLTKASFLTRGSSYYPRYPKILDNFCISFQKIDTFLFEYSLKRSSKSTVFCNRAIFTIHILQLIATVNKQMKWNTLLEEMFNSASYFYALRPSLFFRLLSNALPDFVCRTFADKNKWQENDIWFSKTR